MPPKLRDCSVPDDVKDIYIKALGLKKVTKGLIDIQTDEIWFEGKDTGRHSCYAMFTQLLHYVQQALNKGEHVPPFLAVIDTDKAAIMRSADVLPFLRKKSVKWGKSASQYPQEAFDAVSAYHRPPERMRRCPISYVHSSTNTGCCWPDAARE